MGIALEPACRKLVEASEAVVEACLLARTIEDEIGPVAELREKCDAEHAGELCAAIGSDFANLGCTKFRDLVDRFNKASSKSEKLW